MSFTDNRSRVIAFICIAIVLSFSLGSFYSSTSVKSPRGSASAALQKKYSALESIYVESQKLYEQKIQSLKQQIEQLRANADAGADGETELDTDSDTETHQHVSTRTERVTSNSKSSHRSSGPLIRKPKPDPPKTITATIPKQSSNKKVYSIDSIYPNDDHTTPAEEPLPNEDELFKQLTFWSTDFHITPIADLKYLFQHFGIRVIDKSLSGACGSMGTCARDLKVIHGGNAYFLGDDPAPLSRQLFDAYKNDEEFRKVDAIVCFHPVCTCQLYMPFNKSLLLISSTRYEHGQESPSQWSNFNSNIRKIALSPRNLIAGNSKYDAEYIEYFTGIKAQYVPSFCGGITARYRNPPPRREFLLGHMHVSKDKNSFWEGGKLWQGAVDGINAAKARAGAHDMDFKGINQIYGRYEYQDLANHPAMIHIPYQVSVMSFFEQYRMNLPMFFPSIDFLVQLQLDYAVLSERTWPRIRGRGAVERSDIAKHPSYKGTEHDPNNERSAEALRYWLALSDFYVKPHIQYFDSWDDLIVKLKTTDLQAVSRKMAEHNEEFERDLKEQWRNIFRRLFRDRPANGNQMPQDYDTAMRELYGQ